MLKSCTTIGNGNHYYNYRCESTDCVETVSFNAGWQTRGSGRNYASHTGIISKRKFCTLKNLYIYMYILYTGIL